jgi:hypothetical protein
MLVAGGCLLRAADLKPETAAAYDQYLKVTEAELATRSTPQNYLWLDSHQKEKTQVWLSQDMLVPRETLEHGEKIAIPDGAIQHWFGAVYLETASYDRVRDMLLNFASYKDWFKPQVIDSRLNKRDGDNFNAFLRLSKKQVTQVVLNVDLTASYTALDPTHGTISVHSTRIGETQHPTKQKTYEQELPAGETNGYLWRLDIYWRLASADVGVYVEMDMISLSRPTGVLHAGKYLNGFQTFPHELADALFQGLEKGFPAPHK